MSEFHIGTGLSGIYAGNVRTFKDGSRHFTGVKHNVTDEVLMAALEWLVQENKIYRVELNDGTVYTLKVEITQEEVQN